MSNSLLSHAFGLVTHEYLKTEYKGGSIIFHIHYSKPILDGVTRIVNLQILNIKNGNFNLFL